MRPRHFTMLVLAVALTLTAAFGAPARPTPRHGGAIAPGTADASSTYMDGRFYSAARAVNGDRTGRGWETERRDGGGWNDNTRDAWPDYLRVELPPASPQVARLRVYGMQNDFRNPVEPTPEMTSLYALRDYDGETSQDGVNWTKRCEVRGNTRVISDCVFTAPAAAPYLRLKILLAAEHFSRVVEVEPLGS